MNELTGTNSALSVWVIEALDEVSACCNWRVFVGAIAAGDQSLIIWLDKESQRLTCAGLSNRGQQNSVELRENRTTTIRSLHSVTLTSFGTFILNSSSLTEMCIILTFSVRLLLFFCRDEQHQQHKYFVFLPLKVQCVRFTGSIYRLWQKLNIKFTSLLQH